MEKISVIIPTYNRERTIRYCLKSVIEQTMKPYEIIVVDDCSKDNTIDIIEKMNIENLKIIKLESNSGAQVARNRGIIEAKGEWIAFQDSDDEWVKDKLEKSIVKALKGNYDMVYSTYYVKRDKTEDMYIENIRNIEGESYKKLLEGPAPGFPSIIVKKKCFLDHGLLDDKVVAYQEWDTSISISKNYKIGYINEPLFIYHLHNGENISKNSLKGAQGYEYIVNKNKNDIIQFLGKDMLLEHYKRIVKMCIEAHQIEEAKKYELKIMDIKYEIIEDGREVMDSNLVLANRYKKYYSICNKWIKILNVKGSLIQYFQTREYKKIYIYSDGELTHRLLEDIGDKLDNLAGIIVKNKCNFAKKYIYYNKYEIDNDENNLIIITPIYAFEEIKNELVGFFKGKIISIEDLINEIIDKDEEI